MSWWVWVLVGFLLLGVEFVATTMHLGLFAIGAFVVAILVAVGLPMPLWGLLVVFTVATLVSFFFIRPVLMRKLNFNEKKVVDSLVGEQALALEDMPAGGNGRAEMRGTTWSARNIGETALLRGQRCIVAGVDGLSLHIRAS